MHVYLKKECQGCYNQAGHANGYEHPVIPFFSTFPTLNLKTHPN